VEGAAASSSRLPGVSLLARRDREHEARHPGRRRHDSADPRVLYRRRLHGAIPGCLLHAGGPVARPYDSRRGLRMEGREAATAPHAVARERRSAIRTLATALEMIKFSHTLFALPFALLAAVLAARGWPSLSTTLKILLAMAGARSTA